MRIGERKPDLLVRLAHRGRSQALVLVLCPAAGKRDIAGPGVSRATGAFHEAHAPGFGIAGQDDRHRCAPGGRRARGRFGIGEPAANLFDARHRSAKIPQCADAGVGARRVGAQRCRGPAHSSTVTRPGRFGDPVGDRCPSCACGFRSHLRRRSATPPTFINQPGRRAGRHAGRAGNPPVPAPRHPPMLYLTMFVSAFLAATFFPFASELTLAASLAAGRFDVLARLSLRHWATRWVRW